MKTPLVLPRTLTLCLLVFFATLLATAQRGSAATITVNSLGNVQANDGVCTLREAIENANGDNQSGSTDCAAGSGADTINISVPGDIALTGATAATAVLPVMTTDMTINGLGAAQTTITGPLGVGPGSWAIDEAERTGTRSRRPQGSSLADDWGQSTFLESETR